ncbi:nucleoside ABC transporter substrate-binding protein BmpC [Borreliella burgdorferi]|uniref:Basic membrane protein C n=4 Tax=Borreliella burgdorferi TaxID=139 RepID=BMPC_BORBN|nr:nucleoside ABC transporter substrate-binding protein BmpC [Borreliella burgdorferi]E4QEZ3.1 RecName: Full=Basic membrane protein C; Flags: Precursor [Borreliella burgdorferi N40]AGS66398.1 basic membrane protein C [Borreliella burgdorferi CA382]AAC44711.1 membrane lipoprotein BmpC [Borreliella burgdorferi 297]AAG00583.1 BmpC [Borreliella burgdorferi N40]ADQ29530.1 basic membrane protein C [Borreliella burgdorferi N40]ATH09943.1 nucleoside ABC transporter substrate-binding protein BmpC [Bor
MFKRFIFITLSLLVFACFKSNKKSIKSDKVVVGVLAHGSFYDKGYNQSVHDGVVKLRDNFGIKLITKSLRPYPIEGKRLLTVDEAMTEDAYEVQKNPLNLFWLIGYRFSDLSVKLSYERPDIYYGIIDAFDYGDIQVPKNSLAIKFRNEEAAFLAGYIAAKMSRKEKIGFLTGPMSEHLKDFKFGFKAGIFYANPKLRLVSKKAPSLFDKEKGKAMALFMYKEDKVGVIFPIAGITGLGVYDAAKELGPKYYVIGLNQDQSYIAPQNVITSIIKDIGKVIYSISSEYINNRVFKGGIIIDRGLKEGVIEIVKDPDVLNNRLVDEVIDLENKIISGEIIVPDSEYAFDLFKSKL